jgi:hypothetical protein
MTQNDSLHLAAQYLAMAGKSFIASKPDDSHTNLAWNSEEKQLESRSLNEGGLKLALNYQEYSLDFIHPKSGVEASYPLVGARHLDIINWISREVKFAGIAKEYNFDLHYKLPYLGAFDADFLYPEPNPGEITKLIQFRWLADKAIQVVSNQFHSLTQPRIWPHHFDTGAIGYFDINKKVSVGLGLAMPDDMVADWYFYVSGYHGTDAIKTDEFKPLKNGVWRSEAKWNGATLTATGQSMPIVGAFLSEAIKAF